MNPFLILSIVLAVTVIALVIYIVLDKIKRKKEIDELIEFLTKVQDRDTFPELGLEAEGRMLILRSEIYKLASTLQEQYSGEVKKNVYMADMLSNISHQIKTPLHRQHRIAGRPYYLAHKDIACPCRDRCRRSCP